MIACGFEDVREHKPAVSGKNPVHPVHRCESKIYPCLTMNRFPATRRRRLFQVSPAPALPGGSYESETGVIQARCQFLSNPCCFNLLNRFCVTRTRFVSGFVSGKKLCAGLKNHSPLEGESARAEPAVEPVGGQTLRPVSDYQRCGQGSLGGIGAVPASQCRFAAPSRSARPRPEPRLSPCVAAHSGRWWSGAGFRAC